ncbi:MAG: hypothetical protein IPL10_02030 [Bacteroidetes bacterium]|nr:hypothetical protein [Bacteroidota bacterium]
MNWKKIFSTLIENNRLDEAIEYIEASKNFKTLDSDNNPIELNVLETGKTEGVVYDYTAGVKYCLKYHDDIITVGSKFLLESLNSQKLNQNLINKNDGVFTFFDFQFLIYMSQAADVSSGFTWFKNSVKEICESLKIGKANLNGVEILNEEELNTYLKNRIYGFESLFISVGEICRQP